MTTASRPAGLHHDQPATRRKQQVWTAERIRALGAVTDLTTAASIFNLSRAVAYDLAKHGRFPVPVIRAGSRYRVPVAAILTALHLADNPARHRRLDPAADASVDHPQDIGSTDPTRNSTFPSQETTP